MTPIGDGRANIVVRANLASEVGRVCGAFKPRTRPTYCQVRYLTGV
jgi:hypothetical protein